MTTPMSQHSNGSGASPAATATNSGVESAKATASAADRLPSPHKRRFPSGHEIARAVRDALGELGLGADTDAVRDAVERRIGWRPSQHSVDKQRKRLKADQEDSVAAVRVEPDDDDEDDD